MDTQDSIEIGKDKIELNKLVVDRKKLLFK